MIEMSTTQPDLAVTGEKITFPVLGRPKTVATAFPGGLEVRCKVIGAQVVIPYEQLMSVPTFRAGILAVLATETSTQAAQ
jgi:hypothetical protein